MNMEILKEILSPQLKSQISSQEVSISPERKNVAMHEMQHAVVALAKGIDVIGVSVKPTAEYKGITRFSPSSVIGNEQGLLVTVMASSVSVDGTIPSGLAGDNYQAYMLSGGDQLACFSAQLQASMILSSFGHELLDKCSDILAVRGEVGRSGLKDIIEEAMTILKVEKQLPFDIEKLTKDEPVDSEYFISLINKGDGIPQLVKEYRCCGGINTHRESCPNANRKDESIKKSRRFSRDPDTKGCTRRYFPESSGKKEDNKIDKKEGETKVIYEFDSSQDIAPTGNIFKN